MDGDQGFLHKVLGVGAAVEQAGPEIGAQIAAQVGEQHAPGRRVAVETAEHQAFQMGFTIRHGQRRLRPVRGEGYTA